MLYSGFEAKVCRTLLALAWLVSLSACFNAYDSHLRSPTHDILPIGATKINVYGQRDPENRNFCLLKSLIFDFVLGSCDHIQWFQWLKLTIHHGYVTLVGSHMHLNKQKNLKDMLEPKRSCTLLPGIYYTIRFCTHLPWTHCIWIFKTVQIFRCLTFWVLYR